LHLIQSESRKHHEKPNKTTTYFANNLPGKLQLVVALCAVMAGSLKETHSANLRDAPCSEIQFD